MKELELEVVVFVDCLGGGCLGFAHLPGVADRQQPRKTELMAALRTGYNIVGCCLIV